MYYGIGSKEDILDDLDTQINTIAGIAYVDWQRADWLGIDPSKYPGVFINDLRTDRKQMLKNIWKNTFSVGLVCFVWADAGENLGTKINDFINDVKTAVLTDPSRNSNAYDTDIDIIATDQGSAFPQGMFVMSLSIIFFSRT